MSEKTLIMCYYDHNLFGCEWLTTSLSQHKDLKFILGKENFNAKNSTFKYIPIAEQQVKCRRKNVTVAESLWPQQKWLHYFKLRLFSTISPLHDCITYCIILTVCNKVISLFTGKYHIWTTIKPYNISCKWQLF